MGLFDTISSVVETVADTVEGIINEVSEVVSDVVESIGNAVQDVCNSASNVPVLGPVLSWLGGVISSIFDFAAAVIKVAFTLIAIIFVAQIKIVGGILSLNPRLILDGLYYIPASLFSAVLLVAGKGWSIGQNIFFQEPGERPLTREEALLLYTIYENSLALYNIRIVPNNAGLYTLHNPDPFTFGNTIYMKGKYDPNKNLDLLVHESVHVWQYQNLGAKYLAEAIFARDYLWQPDVPRLPWLQLKREGQASFIEDLYTTGILLLPDNKSDTTDGAFFRADNQTTHGAFIFNGTNYTSYANTTVATIRKYINLRYSKLFQ